MSFTSHPRQAAGGKLNNKGSSGESLETCLEQFRMEEKLSAEDSWYCGQCKDHVQASKKLELYSTAPFLIMSLNRFKSHNVYFKEKLEDLIDFPTSELDMSKHVLHHQQAFEKDNTIEPLIYDLCGVINHYGTMNFGHYTAFGKNSISGKWYEFNDSNVSKKSADDVCSSAAYVLFFKQRSFYPQGHADFEALKKAPVQIEQPEQLLIMEAEKVVQKVENPVLAEEEMNDFEIAKALSQVENMEWEGEGEVLIDEAYNHSEVKDINFD